MPLISGQGSGDFRETYSRIHAFHIGGRWGSSCVLTQDGFTQRNPAIVTDSVTKSLTLTGVTKVGVLSSSVAFTRSDIGNGLIGGPPAGYLARARPLGLFINDAVGQLYENRPGLASGKLAYYHEGTFGSRIWETQVLITADGGTAGDPLTYEGGDILYASANGLLTNRYQDAYQYNVTGQDDIGFVTALGIVLQSPSTVNDLLVYDFGLNI